MKTIFNFKNHIKSHKGISLAELMIALVVLAILATILLSALTSGTNASFRASSHGEAATIAGNLMENIKILGVEDVTQRFTNDNADDDFGCVVCSFTELDEYKRVVLLSDEHNDIEIIFDSGFKFLYGDMEYDYAELNKPIDTKIPFIPIQKKLFHTEIIITEKLTRKSFSLESSAYE